jgi:hypothetical protein
MQRLRKFPQSLTFFRKEKQKIRKLFHASLFHKCFAMRRRNTICSILIEFFSWHHHHEEETHFGAGKISESFRFRLIFNDFFMALTFIASVISR